ncbi:MAG: extracellular solute-binding protein [Treponema sp.]|jgi:putative aldouronate transport system substrate-binding protein|nr:extracellular solute-binding protein [Treponema sp.]
MKEFTKIGPLLIILLAAVFSTGCKPKDAGTGTAADGSAAGTLKKLVFATTENTDPNYSYKNKLPVWAELEKRTGVEIEFEVTAAADFNSVMSVRMAAGVNLPDIARLPAGNPLQYAVNGLIIPLNDLIGQYGPNITALFENRSDVRKTLTAPDGKIYVVAAVVDARSNVNFPSFSIRKDWLAKLGISEPDTIADWYTMLKAFKTGDPNGNGKADEIPLMEEGRIGSSANANVSANGLFRFATAWGLHLYMSDGWYTVGDKVVYDWLDPRLRDFLAEMHKWYAEGLIDPEFSTQNNEQYTAKAIGNIAGADTSTMSMMFPQWNQRMQASYPGTRWETVDPPMGPNGDRFLIRETPIENVYFGITRDCKDPVTALKWLDYMYASPEGQILMCNFGIEGDTYTMIDGKPTFGDTVLKYERGSGLAMEIRGMNTPSFPRILMSEMIEQRFMIYPDEVAAAKKASQYYIPPFPVIMATDEENTEYVSIMTDIDTLRNEYIFDFITGRKNISQFDSYVNQVKAMGIDRAVAIKQAQYNRYQGITN